MNSVLFVCVLGYLCGGIYGIVNPDVVIEQDLGPSAIEQDLGPTDSIDKDSRQKEISISWNKTSITSNDLKDAMLETNLISKSNEEFDFMDNSEEFSDSKYKENVIDENGCHITLRDELEGKCFHNFELNLEESMHINDTAESEKAICCAVEDYEKCCIRQYKRANCANDKDSLKETLKAARMFLSVMTSISCSGHRGRCLYTSSSGDSTWPYFLLTMIAPLFTRHF